MIVIAMVVGALALISAALVLSGNDDLPATETHQNSDGHIDLLRLDAPDEELAPGAFAPVYISSVTATADEGVLEFDVRFRGKIDGVPVHRVLVHGGNDPDNGDPILLREHNVVVNRSAIRGKRIDEAGARVDEAAETVHRGAQREDVAPEERRIAIDIEGRTAKIRWRLGSGQVDEAGAPRGRWKLRISAQAETPNGLAESGVVLAYADGGWDS